MPALVTNSTAGAQFAAPRAATSRAACGPLSSRPSPLLQARRPEKKASRFSSRRSSRVQPIQLAPGGVEVVTVGEALFDLLASDDQKGKPRAEVESWDPYPGGAPTNVATAVAQLGIKVALFTALGKDDLGDQLMELIASRGVDVSGIIRTKQPTRGVFVERKLDGDRVFAGFAEPMDSYADCFINSDGLPMDLVKGASAVVTGTLGLAYPVTREGMEAVVKTAKENGAVVLIDANWRPMFWPEPDSAKPIIEEYLAKADLVKITDEEAEWLYGIPAGDALDNPDKVLEQLPNASAVMVTAGEKGAAYCIKTAGKSTAKGSIPVLDVTVADTTGAGDAFTAGFLAFMLKAGGLSKLQEDPDLMLQAARWGAATGALTCKGKGAIAPHPTMEEVEEMLKTCA
mmetsp:Transcript_22165/g.61517  ORF Transcript_22165/g.61517 Transcript_22165/m.61517 type:complete len:401 (-) Transcript_22165:157-1359(-)|eukprot:CAMPEP_0117673590 /NCGR_PEP_ID=MMETSP0804-20121206/14556_1 /TAXON_ID=1074897 /ORGANISM="Tetraselmis astigmatica, Strain CCMP880" /LENGTH=400 /DNA_ID=CAMNT_0005482343 /DNA_START=82 /DNA_END=1284 /DNA_ORIENTATION=-